MRRALQLVLFLLVFSLAMTASELVESIVATVNKRPLLASELDDELRFEALEQARPLTSLTPADAKAALDRLVEQELLRQQMQSFALPSQKEVDTRIQSIRALFPQAASEEGWLSVLREYGMSASRLNELVSAQLQTLHFIDFRLRPSARVSRIEVETYYREKLVPQVQAAGATPDPYAAVSAKIQELLTQRKLDELLVNWMNSLRTQSEIRIRWTPRAPTTAIENAQGR